MDIKDKLTAQEKLAFEGLRVETLVLQNLLNEKRQMTGTLFKAIMEKLGHSPMLYGLEFSHGQDKWELKLRPDALEMTGMKKPTSTNIPKDLKTN